LQFVTRIQLSKNEHKAKPSFTVRANLQEISER